MRRFALAGLALACAFASSPVRAQTLQQLMWAYTGERSPRLDEMVQSALAARPQDAELLLFASEVRGDMGDAAESVALARRALALPGAAELKARAHLRLGMAYYQVDDAAAARVQLDSAQAAGGASAQLAAWFAYWLGTDARYYASWRTVESEHLRLHLGPGSRTDARAFLREREATLAEIQQVLEAPMPKRIDIFLWNRLEDAPHMESGPIEPTDPLFGLIHAWPGQTRGHELAHVLAYWAVRSPARGRLSMPPERAPLIDDGTPRYLDGTGQDRLAAARQSTRTAGRDRVSIEALWAARPENAGPPAENVGALLVQRLIERGGRERFLQLLRDPTHRNAGRIYGELLRQVIAETERDLAS